MKKKISINSVAEFEAGDVIISRSNVEPGVQPWAVEREVPEYAPGTAATADVWTDRTQQRLRVFRIPGGWIDEHGEGWRDAALHRHVDEIVPDAPATCAHGETAENLCNRLPDDRTLAGMRAAWNSLSVREQSVWEAGMDTNTPARVPTPPKPRVPNRAELAEAICGGPGVGSVHLAAADRVAALLAGGAS